MAKKEKEIVCDICGSIMLPLYGGGWDNDRMACTNRECGAEIVFPTSTLFEEEENQ
jgi:ribosomal protein S27E